MDILTGLKSLTDKALGLAGESLGTPETFLEAPPIPPVSIPALAAQPDYASEINRLALREYGKARKAIPEVAWRCTLCNTVNGVRSNTTEARKTCRKCARPNTNPFTMKQEFAIRALMDIEGLSQAEAEERTLNG